MYWNAQLTKLNNILSRTLSAKTPIRTTLWIWQDFRREILLTSDLFHYVTKYLKSQMHITSHIFST